MLDVRCKKCVKLSHQIVITVVWLYSLFYVILCIQQILSIFKNILENDYILNRKCQKEQYIET